MVRRTVPLILHVIDQSIDLLAPNPDGILDNSNPISPDLHPMQANGGIQHPPNITSVLHHMSTGVITRKLNLKQSKKAKKILARNFTTLGILILWLFLRSPCYQITFLPSSSMLLLYLTIYVSKIDTLLLVILLRFSHRPHLHRFIISSCFLFVIHFHIPLDGDSKHPDLEIICCNVPSSWFDRSDLWPDSLPPAEPSHMVEIEGVGRQSSKSLWTSSKQKAPWAQMKESRRRG